MKKIVLSIIAIAGCSTTVFAQQQVKFGPKAGIDFANLSNAPFDHKMKTGFYVGAFAEIKFNEQFSIQPEVVYSSQGMKVTEDILQQDIKWKLDYINVPILAKYYLDDRFSIEAGPQIGFLVKAEGTLTGDHLSGSVNTKDSYKSIDFGIGAGLAYDFTMGIFVNARYNLGLTDVWKNNTGNPLKNNVIQIGVGYKFD